MYTILIRVRRAIVFCRMTCFSIVIAIATKGYLRISISTWLLLMINIHGHTLGELSGWSLDNQDFRMDKGVESGIMNYFDIDLSLAELNQVGFQSIVTT